jgi:U3 small nucleolar RNA-associated protein 12
MVKAYLRYVQENIFGAFTSSQSNAVMVKVLVNIKGEKLLVTACNEVVSLSNMRTGEVAFKLYEENAAHGYVTVLAASGFYLAVGYSSGTVVVYNLELEAAVHKGECFEIEHTFSFHRTAVTALVFADDDTQLVSGGADTHIVMYDLVASKAEYKLSGHTEPITKLQVLVSVHPSAGSKQKRLISSAKDGLLKVWDLDLQTCLGSAGEQTMGKVNDFVIVGELGLLLAASSDNSIRVF